MTSDRNSGIHADMKTILERELEHHEQWASEVDVKQIDVFRAMEGSTAPENRFILSHLGDLKGKRILDVGCGMGESSVYFGLNGANCLATDFSPAMVETTLKLAREYGADIEGKCMNSLEMEFPDESFDIVYAANLLHHVEPMAALREMRRVVRKGGQVCFWDPLKHNPLINMYRRIARDVRSHDEKPLDINIMKSVRPLFSSVVYDTFWICTLWIFLRFYLIERADPNKERYWKKILQEEERLRNSYQRLEKLDYFFKRTVPFVKRYAWNIAVVANK